MQLVAEDSAASNFQPPAQPRAPPLALGHHWWRESPQASDPYSQETGVHCFILKSGHILRSTHAQHVLYVINLLLVTTF